MSDKPAKGLPSATGAWTERSRERAERMLGRLAEDQRGPGEAAWAEKAEWAAATAASLAIRVGGGALEPLPLARLRSAAQFSAWKEFFLTQAAICAEAGQLDRVMKYLTLATRLDDTSRLSEVAAHQLAAAQAAAVPWRDPTDALMRSHEGGTDDDGGGLLEGAAASGPSEDP